MYAIAVNFRDKEVTHGATWEPTYLCLITP